MSPVPFDPTWLEQLPLPAGVVRGGRFAYVNAALADLVGHTREAMTNMEFFAPIAEEDRARVQGRHASRLAGEPVADSYEFDIVRTDGERRRVDIWVAQVGPDTVFQLRDRTDAAEHDKKLLALAHLGAAVQPEQTRDSVLARVAEGAAALGLVAMRIEPKGDGIAITACRGPEDFMQAFEEAVGASVLGFERPWTNSTRRAWRDGICYVDDLPIGVHRYFGGSESAVHALGRRAGYRRGVLVRIDEEARPSYLLALAATWLQPDDVPTLSLFGSQITAALAAARSIADLSKRNDELAALNRLATSAGTMTESTELFAGGSAALAEVVGCASIAFYLVRPEEGCAILAHLHGAHDEVRALFGRVPLEGTRLGAVFRAAKTAVLRLDDFADPVVRAALGRVPIETFVVVPLIARAEVIGVMYVGFAEERLFESRELEFLQAAAAHFAATIEASRLVADLRRSYTDLARAQEQLVHRASLAALGEMAAAIAHEVRNPLGAIFNSIGSLRRLVAVGHGDAEVLIGIVAEEAARLNEIVGDLLDFARPVRPELRPGSLEDVVRDAVRGAVDTAADRVEVEIVADAQVPSVPLDARLLHQAIFNVAQNAVLSIVGKGTLRVRMSSVRLEDGPHARVEISNDGPGIPAEVLPRVFEPFFTTRPKGTGLGLAVVKRIVEGHRGRVSVTSDPGKATVFVIDLPAERSV